MRSNKINLILMKDGGQTHKWNVNPKALCFLLGVLLFIPILFALSIWLNIHLYKERNNATQKQIELQYAVDRNTQTIVRLSNLESFLRDHSPGLLGLLVSQSSVDSAIAPTVEGKNEKLVEELNIFIAENNANINTQKAAKEEDTHAEENNNSEKTEETNVEKLETPAQEVETPKTPTEGSSEKELMDKDTQQRIDLGHVKLEKVQIELSGKSLHIQYDLQNTGKTVPLAGDQNYTLINIKNGKVERIPLPHASNDQFRIRNLKIVESTILLTGIEVGKMARIQIDIVQKDVILFRETYPISR